MSDGSYKEVNFNGNPKNGVKNQLYALKYSDGGLYLSQDDLDNIKYMELTITTVSKEGVSKEINLNVSSNGQVDNNSSDIIGNSTDDNLCPICGKPLKPNDSVHTDGTRHSDEEIYEWGVKTGRITPDNNVKDNNKKPTKSPNSNENLLVKNQNLQVIIIVLVLVVLVEDIIIC